LFFSFVKLTTLSRTALHQLLSALKRDLSVANQV